MSAMSIPAIDTGVAIAATTQTTCVFNVIDFTLPELKVPEIKTTTMASTVDSFIGGKVCDQGQLKIKFQHNPSLDYKAFLNVPDTWTVTYPLSGAGTTHANDAFTGFLVSVTPATLNIDNIFVADAVIRVNSVTKTDQS